jgi:hypothetical protein
MRWIVAVVLFSLITPARSQERDDLYQWVGLWTIEWVIQGNLKKEQVFFFFSTGNDLAASLPFLPGQVSIFRCQGLGCNAANLVVSGGGFDCLYSYTIYNPNEFAWTFKGGTNTGGCPPSATFRRAGNPGAPERNAAFEKVFSKLGGWIPLGMSLAEFTKLHHNAVTDTFGEYQKFWHYRISLLGKDQVKRTVVLDNSGVTTVEYSGWKDNSLRTCSRELLSTVLDVASALGAQVSLKEDELIAKTFYGSVINYAFTSAGFVWAYQLRGSYDDPKPRMCEDKFTYYRSR